jgi:hypothetical protein
VAASLSGTSLFDPESFAPRKRHPPGEPRTAHIGEWSCLSSQHPLRPKTRRTHNPRQPGAAWWVQVPLDPKVSRLLSTDGRYLLETRRDRRDTRRWSSFVSEDTADGHPAQQKRGRCAQRQGHSTSKGGISDAPREMQLANWGSSTSGLYSPRESVPVALWVRQRSGRCSLGLPPPQGFLPRTRENAFAPSTSTSFAALLTRRS